MNSRAVISHTHIIISFHYYIIKKLLLQILHTQPHATIFRHRHRHKHTYTHTQTQMDTTKKQYYGLLFCYILPGLDLEQTLTMVDGEEESREDK